MNNDNLFPPRFVVQYGNCRTYEGKMSAGFNLEVDNRWSFEAMTVAEHEHLLQEALKEKNEL